jgi:hypothetical protein
LRPAHHCRIQWPLLVLAQTSMPNDRDQHPNASETLGLEREILRALCASPHLTADRGGLLSALTSYEWRDPEHRVVYEALLRSLTGGSGALGSELPATATRMGFPDVDWAEYFKPSEASQAAEVERCIRALAVASAQLPGQP